MGRLCISCEKGEIIPLAKNNKKYKYKGKSITILRAIKIPTCNHCSAEWIDSKTAKMIDEILEEEYNK